MLAKAQTVKQDIIQLRRAIHQHPELGYQECNTANLIIDQLKTLKIPFKTGCAKTGVVAELSYGTGPTILVRADMDALPIQENTGLEFQSKIPNVMHACGHDTHTAMLMGAIRLLSTENFCGTLRFLFQPAEENNYDDPDGLSGAQRIIEEGHIDDIDAAIALHQMPTMPTGTIAITNGSVMAAADFFEIEITGKASHAGVCPEKGIDAIVIASELILSLQSIVSRQTNPTDTAVISVSTINGGTAANIVADKVKLSGTLRALKETTRNTLLSLIQSRCDAFAKMHHTKIRFHVYYGVPVTENDSAITQIAHTSAISIFGEQNVRNDLTIMGGEDFGYIANKVPSCFALLGTRVTDGEAYPLHSPNMIVNENALPMGAAFLAQTALDLLNELSN